MSNPLVSIVVCCHNRRHYLEQTMESILAQSYRPVEIVVMDDGSTDDTPALMESYGNSIRYFRQENQGAAAARTAACRLARGEYIAFQDDDDLMVPDRIPQFLLALQQYPTAVFATGDWAVIDSNGKLTGERSQGKGQAKTDELMLLKDGYKAVLWPEVTPTPHTSLFRKADGERAGWFDTRFFNAIEDTDFFARLGKFGPIVYVPKIVSYYRRGHRSMCANDVLLAYNRVLLFEKHLRSLNPNQKQMRRRLRFRLLSVLKQIAFYKMQSKNLPDRIPLDYHDRVCSLLTPKERVMYHWYALIRLPVRRLMLGPS